MLVSNLSVRLDRPVLDQTDLKAIYSIDVKWARDDRVGWASEDDTPSIASAPVPSISSALQESLGLKLEARREPIEMLVIDHLEKVPTEN